MAKMSEKMYGNPPKMERDEESGKVAVKKKDNADTTGESEDQGSGETLPVSSRHSVERMDMHSKHQHEHHTHDHGKHGDKKDLHKRHLEEMKSMHARHEKELGGKDKE